ncbi:MAG: phytoene/squalene synthase family protein [Gammaproteobacteria bacterium]|jgi:phytoene synthase|nr:phytoene/squalene synthase family protein [Gammaproteobacteria bacterium]
MDKVLSHSAAMIREGSKSFSGASKLLDSSSKESAILLYSWCRYCDDQIDNQILGINQQSNENNLDAVEIVKIMEKKTQDAINDIPSEAIEFEALRRVLQKHGIPQQYPLEHLQGFRMDAKKKQYHSITDTLEYCYHVAGVVGIMMAYIFGIRDSKIIERAADLGIAFQLTNIARDVIEDAKMGRVYLPSEWLAEYDIKPGSILETNNRVKLFLVIKKLLDVSEQYYESANIGITHLPLRIRWGIKVALSVYRQIGIKIRTLGSNAWNQRVYVKRPYKLFLAVKYFLRYYLWNKNNTAQELERDPLLWKKN